MTKAHDAGAARLRAAPFFLLLLLAALAVFTVAQWWFVKRYASFLWHGYDAATVPVAWFGPLADVPHGDGAPLPAASPGRRTIPAAALAEAQAYAARQDSQALIIARGGLIELERYFGGAGRETPFNPQSMSKSLAGMLTGIAIAEGHIPSVDAEVQRWIGEWRGDPRGRITVQHLLTMSGGLAQISTDYRPVPWSRGTWQHFGTDFNAPILKLPQADPPGSVFDYNNNENNLLGLVIERAAGMSYPRYLGEKLWRPLGLGPAHMYLDRPGGSAMKSCCVLSRPMDWAKLGVMFAAGGRWQGQQVLPAGWVARMSAPSPAFDGYGYTVWRAPLGEITASPPASAQAWWASEPYAAADTVVFSGHGFQQVWVVPSLALVVVRTATAWPPQPFDQAYLPNLLMRALKVPQETPARRGAAPASARGSY